MGLGRGDSRLVIPSLLFFVPFLFCNFSFVWFSLSLFFFFVSLCFPFLVFSRFALCSSCIELPFVYISFLLIKKKKDFIVSLFL